MNRLNTRQKIVIAVILVLVLVTVLGTLGVFKKSSPHHSATNHEHAEHQEHEHDEEEPKPSDLASRSLAYTINLMGDHTHEGMNMSEVAKETDDDTKRANQALQSITKALAKYKDIDAAKADGFTTRTTKFTSPTRTYHFYNRSIKKDGTKLDPAKPNALLYQYNEDSGFKFVGVMYVAAKNLSLKQINEQIYPLSKSIWHQHTNVCRFSDDTKSNKLSQADCQAKGGKFITASAWMTHLFLYEPILKPGGEHDDNHAEMLQ